MPIKIINLDLIATSNLMMGYKQPIHLCLFLDCELKD